MSCSDYWEQQGLSVGKLPTLQDMLACCDEGLLVCVICDEHVLRACGEGQTSPKRRHAMERRLRATIAAMRGLSVKRKRGRGRVILPAESFVLQGGTGLIERRVDARLLLVSDAPAARRMLDASKKEGAAAGLPVRPYALDPWELSLASRVWLGGPWCARERYQVLASAFWEMTFFGFAYDRVVAAQAQAKAERVLSAPADREKPASTVSELRARQAASFGLVVPDPFERDYRSAVAACVGQLNRRAELDLCRRLVHATSGAAREDRKCA